MSIDLAEQTALYRNPEAPIPARVADLLGRMNLDEKIAQLHAGWLKLSSDGNHTWRLADFAQRQTGITVDELLRHGLGQITRPLGTHSVEAREGVRALNALQRRMVEDTRLGIPVMSHEECLVGLMIEGATLFPAPLNYAATWNPELLHAAGREIGRQARSIGCHQGLAPVLDVSRDPRWGRTEETLGEDPYLVGVLACRYVDGLQGERRDLLATLKHFAGHSASEGGRNHAPVHVGPREFNDVFLLPFEMAVKLANAGAVMPAYHDIDGIPCHADPTLIDGTLRGKWGFDGLVVADYAGVNLLFTHHGVAHDEAQAAALTFNAGLDVELPGHECARHLKTAIERGDIAMPVIDAAVSRVLTEKFRLGLFEHPYADPDGVDVNGADAAAVADQVALESIVLLKNAAVLPLEADGAPRVAIIGPTADDPLALLSGYSFPVHLITTGEDARSPVKTPLQAFRERFGSDRVLYAKGCEILRERRAGTPVFPGDVDMARAIDADRQAPVSRETDQIAEAVRVAEAAAVAIVFVGDLAGLFQSGTVGEGSDTDSLDLPGVQQALLDAVVASGTRTVVVQTGGRPYNLGGLEDAVAAHIVAFAPGQGGADALVKLISGAADFSGRLPLSMPKSAGAVPYVYNHKLKSAGTPIAYHFGSRYPFGFGLSYTEFRYGALDWIDQRASIADGVLAFSFEVENVGPRDGTEVVQIYVRDRVASVVRPVRELKGFQRVFVPAGTRRTVNVRLPVDMLNFTDERGERIVEPGEFDIMVGSSSRDIHLAGCATVVGEASRTLDRHWRMICEVTAGSPVAAG
ncbi:TPA: glycoside hydrolase family 3 C-terminal domain-containing protein [Burkholderia cepacia ATCC 25416]|uniref:glycoside hydrolase family 3 N-terminal domain-containing protein n=2 Tax=Burkholderia TaxID=32008 RepID=UPI0003988445|nr:MULTISPECIES: glycoside hydrolase family 3 N-terminal domain-containing protein [Burkholderia]HDR9765055.1 glycoside hydrolase family 3 C-terminal domain-containing protein [Burkholderia cepacia ATCC 25416]ERJ34103.1 Beta-xylosidase [Burkholderia sp. AU4i]KAB1594822.1 beta-glucosidase [Burkholderia cepacia]KVF60348.1 glycosyl hydrolase [Burkholderia cepacia]MCA8076679.1 glycoside hydrolase family 3 C-terminal domain-containing protein [Burkholderia cepacia]